MGRESFSCIGKGMTEQEALNAARSDAKDYYGHQEGYSGSILSATELNSKCIKQPVVAKRCIVDKAIQKGARKWETVFVVTPIGFLSSDSNYYLMRKELKNTTQGNALKEAKKLALQYGKEFEITIEKRLSDGSDIIASVKPKKSEMGEWKFWGEARC